LDKIAWHIGAIDFIQCFGFMFGRMSGLKRAYLLSIVALVFTMILLSELLKSLLCAGL